MNINLSPELEALVRQKVESGHYNNHSEVMREGLRLLIEQDRLRAAHLQGLQVALSEGLAQADRGELRDGAEVMKELRGLLKRRRHERQMSGYRLTPRAEEGLLRTVNYVEQRFGDRVTDRVLDTIEEALTNLGEMPLTGHRRQDLTDNESDAVLVRGANAHRVPT